MARQTRASWVVMGGKIGEAAHCMRCGEGLSLGFPLQIEVFVAATKAFVKVHSRCTERGYQEPEIKTPLDWLASRDTGVSSGTIFSVLMRVNLPYREPDIPHDSADFGRCYRLLARFPEWKARLDEVSAKYRFWAPFVRDWDTLTSMYESAQASNLWDGFNHRLQALVTEAEALKDAEAA